MIKLKIWQKLLLKETLKYIFFFLLGLYLVYVVIDLSTQSGRLVAYSHCSVFELLYFYLQHFIIRLSLLLPLALLLSMIKVLCSMNLHNELTALRMAGISLVDLSKPFFVIAIAFIAINIINNQYLHPSAQNYIDKFQTLHLKRKKMKNNLRLSVSLLDDGSKFIYHKDPDNKNLFHDVFWIKSKNEIWHMKTLDLSIKKPKASYIDILKKAKNKGFMKTDALASYSFDKLHLHKDVQASPYENRSLLSLFISSFINISSIDEKYGSLSNLLFKLEIAIFPLLIVLGLIPFCVRRQISVFFLTSISLFSLIAFYTLMEAAVILGENQVFSPFLAVGLPGMVFSGYWVFFFMKKTNA